MGAPQDPQYQPPPDPSTHKRRLRASQVVGIVLAVAGLVFIFENTARVTVRLLIPELEMPLWVALLIAAAFGALAVLAFQYRKRHKAQPPR